MEVKKKKKKEEEKKQANILDSSELAVKEKQKLEDGGEHEKKKKKEEEEKQANILDSSELAVKKKRKLEDGGGHEKKKKKEEEKKRKCPAAKGNELNRDYKRTKHEAMMENSEKKKRRGEHEKKKPDRKKNPSDGVKLDTEYMRSKQLEITEQEFRSSDDDGQSGGSVGFGREEGEVQVRSSSDEE